MANPKVGDDDPAFDAADHLDTPDLEQLYSPAARIGEVGTDKDAAKAIYTRLAGN
jgi:hypothetical protein